LQRLDDVLVGVPENQRGRVVDEVEQPVAVEIVQVGTFAAVGVKRNGAKLTPVRVFPPGSD
jgi:hypothetical protein